MKKIHWKICSRCQRIEIKSSLFLGKCICGSKFIRVSKEENLELRITAVKLLIEYEMDLNEKKRKESEMIISDLLDDFESDEDEIDKKIDVIKKILENSKREMNLDAIQKKYRKIVKETIYDWEILFILEKIWQNGNLVMDETRTRFLMIHPDFF